MTASANWNEGGLKLTGGQLFEPGKGLISNPGLLVRNGRIEAVGERRAAALEALGGLVELGHALPEEDAQHDQHSKCIWSIDGNAHLESQNYGCLGNN